MELASDHTQIFLTQTEDLAHHPDLLSREELARAGEIQSVPRRERYRASRVFVRSVLAGILQRPPETLLFGRSMSGKPFLQDCALRFNLSHSENWLSLAVSLNEVGTDIEVMRPIDGMDDVMKQFLSASEAEKISDLSHNMQLRAFYRSWTCKEAVLKARGTGLLDDPKQIDLSLLIGREESPVIETISSGLVVRSWLLNGTYALALAGTDRNVTVHQNT